ncbi:molybdopterin-dependent oxidoreductase [Bradyrhizobium japonicum]|uniref:molybdopterin-dependent oxidoreductase n=2 Tax=Nitrobacteraceae TaxID=41294 RepID=UPI001FD91A26|nr:molybdopterin-dependent oxidoreductase [Bradyrhizobium japonicum]
MIEVFAELVPDQPSRQGPPDRNRCDCDHGRVDRAVSRRWRWEVFRPYPRCRTQDRRRPNLETLTNGNEGDAARNHDAREVTMTAGKWLKTACNLCYINCGIEVLVNDGRLEKVRGDRSSPKSQGYLCNKASRIPYYAHHRDRLTSPLRRRADGGFDEIGWDVAIAEIAARLRDVVDQYGGKSIALYGGGGQGNHAGGAYGSGLLRALGSRSTFNALSQEKTGDFWVNGHMFGSQTCHTAEDVHHCDLLLVIGANPWIAHGFPNARDHLNQIRKDPARKLIVIDPRRTETAEMANLHLSVRPGADAFLLGALLATLVRSDRIDRAFIDEHTIGFPEVRQALLNIPVEAWAAAADIPVADIERCAAMIAAAKAMVVRVELGIQQGTNSTLNSYLEKLLIMLSGSFGRKGTNQLHSWLQPLWGNSPNQTFAPTGDVIIGGLLPPNIFPEAVLKDHPDRLRCAGSTVPTRPTPPQIPKPWSRRCARSTCAWSSTLR